MADSIHNRSKSSHVLRACCALLPMLLSAEGGAAATAPSIADADFTWSADVLNSDFRTDTLDISGNVRVKQGPSSIEAQTAKARGVRAETQRWTFEDSVHIRTAEADLQSNLATAAVINGQIANARIEGTPARFEQIGASDNRQVRGRAGVIEYDFNTGIVKLTNQVWFSNGKDEFRGDVVIYSVRDERVQINPGGSSNRVRGIIRPNQNGAKTQGNSGGAAGGTAAIVEPQFDEQVNDPLEDQVEGKPEPRVATESGGGA